MNNDCKMGYPPAAGESYCAMPDWWHWAYPLGVPERVRRQQEAEHEQGQAEVEAEQLAADPRNMRIFGPEMLPSDIRGMQRLARASGLQEVHNALAAVGEHLIKSDIRRDIEAAIQRHRG